MRILKFNDLLKLVEKDGESRTIFRLQIIPCTTGSQLHVVGTARELSSLGTGSDCNPGDPSAYLVSTPTNCGIGSLYPPNSRVPSIPQVHFTSFHLLRLPTLWLILSTVSTASSPVLLLHGVLLRFHFPLYRVNTNI